MVDHHRNMYKDAYERGLYVCLNYRAIPIVPGEENNPSLSITMRILFDHIKGDVDGQYTKFWERYNKKFLRLTIKDVLKWISTFKPKDQVYQILILQVDETQVLVDNKNKDIGKDSFFSKLIEAITSARLYISEHSTIIIPILTGTNANQLYNEFMDSDYRQKPINLPLLNLDHFKEII